MKKTTHKHKSQSKKKTQQPSRTQLAQQPPEPRHKTERTSPHVEHESKCSVCREILKKSSQNIECFECKKQMHRMCHQGEVNINEKAVRVENENGKKFVCDMCTEKTRKVRCCVCQQVGPEEVLKKMKASNEFIHVECAILSPVIEVESYSKLNFTRKMNEKSEEILECCGNAHEGVVVTCVDCELKGHFRCLIVEQGEVEGYYMASKWLDKTEKNNFLLNHILAKKKHFSKLFPNLKEPKYNELIVCVKHQDTYPWCPCANRKISNEKEYPSYECETCGRYYHQPCSGLPRKTEDLFYCTGCKDGDIFKRELKLHELLSEISSVENDMGGHWNEKTIRLLNAFPFKYSHLLKTKIDHNSELIQSYFAKREIETLFEKKLLDKNSSEAIKLLLMMTFGNKWQEKEEIMTKTEVEFSAIVSEILGFKTFAFPQEIKDKIKSILSLIKPQPQPQQSKEFEMFKKELISFTENCKNSSGMSSEKLCQTLTSLTKKLQESYLNYEKTLKRSESTQLTENLSKILGSEFFVLLITNKVDERMIGKMLEKYSKIKYYQNSKAEIKEEEYYEIMNESNNASFENQEIYSKLMEKLKYQASTLNIAYQLLTKEETFHLLMKKIKEKDRGLTTQAFTNIENTSIREGVCMIEPDKCYISAKLTTLESNMLKKKILRMASQGDDKIDENSWRNIGRIKSFLKKINETTEKDREIIENYVGKLEYVESIMKRISYKDYSHDVISCNSEEKIENNIFTQISQFFEEVSEDKWTEIEGILSDIDTKCASKNLKFDYPKVTENLRNFIRKVMARIEDLFLENHKISINMLRRLHNIIQYLGLAEEFEYLQDEYDKIKSWLQIFSPEEQRIDIGTYLERPELISGLLENIETKLSAAEEITKVKINEEMYKFCLLRQWCRLTEKINLIYKAKPTINAVQTLKSLIDKTQYPENNLWKKVSDLDTESRKINKEIAKFLEKTKFGNKLNFYDEIKFVSHKITLEEGQTIRIALEKSNLDTCVEKQELETEMKEFESLPTNLGLWAEKKSLEEIRLIRRKIIESCFRPEKMEEYERLLRKFFFFKCTNFEPPITREEYFQLLSVGGVVSIELEQKTQNLKNAYKALELAENELLNPPKRRNFAYLLPWSESEYRQIKESLKYDPTEQSKLEKCRIQNYKLRDEFQNIKERRFGDLEKFKELEYELSCSIFNNFDIIHKIGSIRKDFNHFMAKVEEAIPYSQQNKINSLGNIINDNIFRKDRALLEAYLSIGIRHPLMDKFESDCRLFRKIEQMKPIEIEKYEEFVLVCQKISDPASKVRELLEMREKEFLKAAEIVEENEKNNLNFYQTLIKEGLELKRLNSPKSKKIFDKVFTFYEHIKRLTENKQEESNEECESNEDVSEESDNRKRPNFDESDSESDPEENNEIDDSEDDSELDEYDEEMDEEDDEEEEESSSDENGNPNKKPDQIVLDDSD